MSAPYVWFWPGTPGGYVPVLGDAIAAEARKKKASMDAVHERVERSKSVFKEAGMLKAPRPVKSVFALSKKTGAKGPSRKGKKPS